MLPHPQPPALAPVRSLGDVCTHGQKAPGYCLFSHPSIGAIMKHQCLPDTALGTGNTSVVETDQEP